MTTPTVMLISSSMASQVGSLEESGAPAVSSQMLIVRLMPEDEHLNLSYVLKGKKHNLRRDKQEGLGKTLKRISITAVRTEKLKRSQRRHMQSQNEHVTPIEAYLLAGSQRVTDDTPNCEAWLEGRVLVVDDAQFTVYVNIPTVLSLKMPRFIMSNCPAVPEVSVTVLMKLELSIEHIPHTHAQHNYDDVTTAIALVMET